MGWTEVVKGIHWGDVLTVPPTPCSLPRGPPTCGSLEAGDGCSLSSRCSPSSAPRHLTKPPASLERYLSTPFRGFSWTILDGPCLLSLSCKVPSGPQETLTGGFLFWHRWQSKPASSPSAWLSASSQPHPPSRAYSPKGQTAVHHYSTL